MDLMVVMKYFQQIIYIDGKSVDDIIVKNTQYTNNGDIEYKDTQIWLAGEIKDVKEIVVSYYYTYSSPISYPASFPASYSTSYPVSYGSQYVYKFTTTYLVFEYEGQVVSITNYGFDDSVVLGQYYSVAKPNDIEFIPMYHALQELYHWYYMPYFHCGGY